jgi:hypothetical protein
LTPAQKSIVACWSPFITEDGCREDEFGGSELHLIVIQIKPYTACDFLCLCLQESHVCGVQIAFAAGND